MRPIVLLVLFCFCAGLIQAQETDTTSLVYKIPALGKQSFRFNYNSFAITRPALENPRLGWNSPIYREENIIVDGFPAITFHFFKNYNQSVRKKKKLGMSYYLSFLPHFRMYSKESNPVLMPSYKFFLGLKHMYHLGERHIFGYKFESGHYSNGQDGCAFSSGNNTRNLDCDSLFRLINNDTNLSEKLNRQNGDFSTNLTNLVLDYRFVSRSDEGGPKQIHSFSLGVIVYHNNFFGIIDKGGLGRGMIDIYGRFRFSLGYHYTYRWKSGYRILFEEYIELISGAHPWVNPFRSLTSFTLYFPRNVGIYVNYIYGHDDYNIRFVDSGQQFGMGVSWDLFPPKR